jgi:pterin-4a-carbinolamine dehydratase
MVPPSAGISLRPHAAVAAPPARPPVAEEPLELVAEDKPTSTNPEPPKSKIHGISSVAALAQHSYTRPTHSNKTGAVRMRTFHCRLSEQGVEYLDQIVNDWLEHHPDIEVKFVTSTIGLWDGKLKEPTLILNVWY